MFDLDESAGVFDSWVERWRTWRGIDKWPIVYGEVVHREYISDGEGGYYKLTMKYRIPTTQTGYQPLTVVTLSSNSDAAVGDMIQLRANPEKPMKAVFASTQQSASTVMGLTIFAAVATFLAIIHSCNAFFAYPH